MITLKTRDIETLDINADIAITPVVTSLEIRAEAIKSYAYPLQSLHTYPLRIIERTIKQYNDHLNQFMAAIEDDSQSPAIKLPLLRFPMQDGLHYLAAGAYAQIRAQQPDRITRKKSDLPVIKDYLNSRFGAASNISNYFDASPSSIIYHVQSKIDFAHLTDRICKVAENTEETISVRQNAIHALDRIYKLGVQNFGVDIDRAALEERITIVGLTTNWISLRQTALEFSDGVKLASRIPLQP